MSSAISFNSEQSKILSSANELSKGIKITENVLPIEFNINYIRVQSGEVITL